MLKKVLISFFVLLTFLPVRLAALPADAYVAVVIPPSHTSSVDGLATYIKEHYSGVEAQLWALYSWEAAHLRYNIEKRDVQLTVTNPDDLATWTLEHGEGVCANFAALFYAVATRLGVESYLIGGYSVTHNNYRDDGHEWVGCIVEGKPYFFDPTWGGGYMLNDVLYVHRLDASFFMVEPANMVRTHMPEDPLFQFLDFPHYYDDIDNPGASHPVPVYFNWRDSLVQYNAQDTLARLGGQVARMRANGFANDWIAGEINRLQHNYEVCLLNSLVDRYNKCVPSYQALYAMAYSSVDVKSEGEPATAVDNLRDLLTDISNMLDDTEFSTEALSNGAAQVQQQVQMMVDGLLKIEKAINKRYK